MTNTVATRFRFSPVTGDRFSVFLRGTDETWLGFVAVTPSHWYAETRTGIRLPGVYDTSAEAALALEGHRKAGLQRVELSVSVVVDPEMWELAYGDVGGFAGLAEDVRVYIESRIWESSQARPGGEGGIADVDVDHA